MYYVEDENSAIDKEKLEKDIDALLSYLEETGDFSIHFISDDEMRVLNRDFREKDEPTDILSFAINDGEAFRLRRERRRILGISSSPLSR